MEIKKGIGVSPGVAICKARVLDAEEFNVPQRHVKPERVAEEAVRLRQALEDSSKERAALRDRAAMRLGTETAKIFDFHLALLSDPSLISKFEEMLAREQ